ncbi:hypothetical protein [Pseudomonas sp. CM25]|uniref:hypothetical protein n=1 Tax=Pseudomonas sp. CM25 TaxID=2738448 RepID=UPI002113D621|nr:hypothetical protein [Pseudomonas sp. CM25]
MPPHNLVFILVRRGCCGWAGSATTSALDLPPTRAAGMEMLATMVAACAGIIGWLPTETVMHGRPMALGEAYGASAGLVGN